MERVSKRARLTFVLLLLTLACLAVAGAQAPKQGRSAVVLPQNASGCSLIPGTYYYDGDCAEGSGGCYFCEYSDPSAGTYGCYEAPDARDGIQCFALDQQW